MSDWRIIIEPHGEGERSTIDILAGDEADAVEALEGWAKTIDALGYIPDSLDVRSTPGCAVRGRQGRLSFRIRCDSFERETESGPPTTGAGYLRAVEDPA